MANGKAQAHLENTQYVATPADIKALTKEQLSAITVSVRSKVTYLRALIATTQNSLGLVPRVRSVGQPVKVPKETIKEQLVALETVHEGFYASVLEAIEESPLGEDEKPKSGRGSANAIKTRRATFARSAMSTVRSWIKHGHDLANLSAAKATKTSLTIKGGQGRTRKVSPKRLIKAAQKQTQILVATLLQLAETDKAGAAVEYQNVMGMLSDQMVKLGVAATRDAAVAIAEHRPLTVGRGKNATVFIPTATHVLRQQARPS